MIKDNVKADKWLIIAVVVVAVLGAVYAWWFFSTHEKVDYGTQYTPKSEIRQNRYHTAELLIEKTNGNASTLKENSPFIKGFFGDTKSAKQTAVIMYRLSESRNSELDKMMNWVSLGGHLVVFSHAVSPADTSDDDYQEYLRKQNPLLKRLGIHYQRYPTGTFTNIKLQNHSDVFFNELATPLNMDGELVIGQGTYYVTEFGRFVADEFFNTYPNAKKINHDWRQKTKDGYGILPTVKSTLNATEQKTLTEILNKKDHWLNDKAVLYDPDNLVFDVNIGKGRLTVLSHNDIFINPNADFYNAKNTQQKPKDTPTPSTDWQLLTTNNQVQKVHGYTKNIMQADNGELLLRLVGERQVYFMPDIQSMGFLDRLWRYLPYAMIGLFLTIGATLLALPRQFGAVRHFETDKGRNIIGFFAQVGRYLWQSDQAESLVEQNRQLLLNHIRANIHLSPNDDVVSVLSQKTGLSAGLIHEALYGQWQNESEFLRVSQSFKILATHFDK